MAQAKRGSKRKRGKAALVLGAAGFSLAMAGGASATAPTTNLPSQDTARELFSLRRKSLMSAWRPSTSSTEKASPRFAEA
jgi:hypothetical protein